LTLPFNLYPDYRYHFPSVFEIGH